MGNVLSSHDYLIIAGTTRAATTSMFNYLADHPEVCASSWKETRFFLDPDYPLDIPYSLDRDGIERYESFFNLCARKRVRLEATPDYLYSPNTAYRIYSVLPDARLIFLLREPISRLISWYRFARQRNLISQDLTFDRYVRIQLECAAPNTQPFLALEQGCYSRYLQVYFDVFAREQILVIFLEELNQDPFVVMQEICAFVDISPTFYRDYHFEVINRSGRSKNPKVYGVYVRVKRFLRRYTAGYAAHQYLRPVRKFIDRWFLQEDQRDYEQLFVSPETRSLLEQYYREENLTLAALLGRSLPWERA